MTTLTTAVQEAQTGGVSNTGLASVRCDMLQYRAADKMVLVATHGRGIFTSDVFADPLAEFEARTTWFVNRPLPFIDLSLAATSWAWDFDVNINPGVDATHQNPTHTYTSTGNYTVQLTINGGADLETKNLYITILDEPTLPYSQEFDINDGGFFPYRLQIAGIAGVANRDWQWGASTSSNFNAGNGAATIQGAAGWATSLNENHGFAQRYALESPPFSLAGAVGNVFLDFEYRAACGTDAGFLVEYSTDQGLTWLRLGETQSSGLNPSGTLNWYNVADIQGIYNQPGFSQSSFSVFNPRYNITFLSGEPDVRFRYVFGTRSSANDGIQIDNFMIDGFISLPLRLIRFTAQREDTRSVELFWEASHEGEDAGFEIQKSLDGLDFQAIGFVPVEGEASSSQFYRFYDTEARPAAYYRLRQTDQIGPRSFSKVIFINAEAHKEFAVFPNPYTAGQPLRLQTPGVPEEAISADLFNAQGYSIGQWQGSLADLEKRIQTQIDPLAPGTYFLKIRKGFQEYTQKLIKF